jgi:hypothetical protein
VVRKLISQLCALEAGGVTVRPPKFVVIERTRVSPAARKILLVIVVCDFATEIPISRERQSIIFFMALICS